MSDNNISVISEKISKGEIPIGTVISLCDPEVSEIICSCGFDFIWIDAEHALLDKKAIDMHIMAVRASGAAPFVRVAWNDPVLVKPILDMGPAAIIFPFIKTADDARLAVSSCKYPPEGIRGFGPRRANNFSSMEINEYLKKSKSEPWVILQIEHIDGVKNLKEILEVNGVDCIVIGPNDLSGSIGLLGQTEHEEVIKLLNNISEICIESNTIFFPSIGFKNKKCLEDWIKRGANMLCLDWDVGLLRTGGLLAIEAAKNIMKSK